MGILVRDGLVQDVIGCAIAVHQALGPGLLESAYEYCLAEEFSARGIDFGRQVPIPVTYRSARLDCGYRADFVVGGRLLLELKSVERLLPVLYAQVLTYLKLLKVPHGLLINFNVARLVNGLKSFLLSEPSS